jgi:hypothetical protein
MAEPVRNWLMTQASHVKGEFAVAWGICDFVACEARPGSVSKRLELGQRNPIGPQMRISILSTIPDESNRCGISIDQLWKQFSVAMSRETLEVEVERLVKSKFAFRTSTGALKSRNGWKPLHSRVLAVEMKLNRISEVIAQARKNLSFATASYIALPSLVAHNFSERRSRKKVEKCGIGVISVSREKCTVLVPPSETNGLLDGISQSYVVERFWNEIKTGSGA